MLSGPPSPGNGCFDRTKPLRLVDLEVTMVSQYVDKNDHAGRYGKTDAFANAVVSEVTETC